MRTFERRRLGGALINIRGEALTRGFTVTLFFKTKKVLKTGWDIWLVGSCIT